MLATTNMHRFGQAVESTGMAISRIGNCWANGICQLKINSMARPKTNVILVK